ncbi:biosynthetic arginine decarboxylase [Utexia brackfieldae]|uniref:biosynthetic arginine decarboxylase n=1 Tax=Utexia brackfieldae TaxID=3074108 RepID=UPI00370D36FD
MSQTAINKLVNTYNINHWGNHYFSIDEKGCVNVCPDPDFPEAKISLTAIAQQLEKQSQRLPVLINFPQIIQHRLRSINAAFKTARASFGYQGDYFLVYPIKVNQHRRVIDALTHAGEPLGLEAGSKAELMAVLNHAALTRTVIVCNGYKDREYIQLALMGEKLGHKVYLVLEKMTEIDLVLEEAKKLNVTPRLGVRARLASEGAGKWQSSGGEKSKFGLSANQILNLIDILKQKNYLPSLQLLHFHLGSQLANIRDIANGVKESARFYVELHKLGVNIKCFDVGGGLGIDYEGTRSKSDCSVNYGLNEYANNIIWGIGDACNEHGLPHPTVITESGRAVTAHHSVLVTNVIGIEQNIFNEQPKEPDPSSPRALQSLWSTWLEIHTPESKRALREQLHDSQLDVHEVHLQYMLGTVNLTERAWAEQIYLQICHYIEHHLDLNNRTHRALIDELEERMADKLYLNFSLFQSMPDAWGIEQLFPVLPLSGLDKPINRRVVLLDITCDSDGMIEKYIDGDDITKTMPMPDYDPNNPPLFGFFLIGAYQEILGNMHNLFGDTSAIDVFVFEDGNVEIDAYEKGNTVADMLRYVNLDPAIFMENYQQQIMKSGLDEQTQQQFMAELESSLQGYTYLEDV